MTDEIRTIIDRARALLAAATPGPWEVVGFWGHRYNEYGISSKVAWDHPNKPMHFAKVHPTDVQPLGDALARANASIIAAAPELLGTLCDALESAERRAEEAEAQAAAMHGVVSTLHEMASNGIQSSGPLSGMHPAILARLHNQCERALGDGATGRALLDRLRDAEARVRVLSMDVDALNRTCVESQARERDEAARADAAEAERDTLRAEVEKESALRAELTAELHRLRAAVGDRGAR